MVEKLAKSIDKINTSIGRWMNGAILIMVLVTFLIVILRYMFKVGWVWMQEIVLYAHGFVFLLACAATLKKEAHVRVDIFFREMAPRKKALVNLWGAALLLIPTCILILVTSIPYVLASWQVFEGSKDGGGLEAVFILKSVIPLFALLTGLQGVSLIIESYKTLRGENA